MYVEIIYVRRGDLLAAADNTKRMAVFAYLHIIKLPVLYEKSKRFRTNNIRHWIHEPRPELV